MKVEGSGAVVEDPAAHPVRALSRGGRLLESEATAFGAAYLAAQQAGLPWAKALLGSGVDKEFSPKISAEQAAKLRAGWLAFVSAQQQLGAQMRELGV